MTELELALQRITCRLRKPGGNGFIDGTNQAAVKSQAHGQSRENFCDGIKPNAPVFGVEECLAHGFSVPVNEKRVAVLRFGFFKKLVQRDGIKGALRKGGKSAGAKQT